MLIWLVNQFLTSHKSRIITLDQTTSIKVGTILGDRAKIDKKAGCSNKEIGIKIEIEASIETRENSLMLIDHSKQVRNLKLKL